MATTRTKQGQFKARTRRDPFALYALVRVVAIKAAELVNAAAGAGAIPLLPNEVTERQFDAARQHVEGHQNIPTARRICEQLPDRDGKPFAWRELLKLVFDERDIERVHMERLGRLDDPHIGETHVYYALNRAASHLGKKTLTRIDYAVTSRLLIKADARRRNGGWLSELFPTIKQIEFFLESRYMPKVEATADESGLVDVERAWDYALEIAELEPRPDKPHVAKAVLLIEGIIRFYTIVGVLPSSNRLRDFARDFNFSLEDYKPRVIAWPDVLKAALLEIAARGLPEPPPYRPREHTYSWEVPDQSPWPDDPPYRAKTFYTHAMVLTVVAEFSDWLGVGAAPTVPAYTEFSRGDPDRPSMAVINAHGGLDQLFEELADPKALERAHRDLNPTADELAKREHTELLKKLRHPTPQGILRVTSQRGEAGSREIEQALGLGKGSSTNWLPLLMKADLIEMTTPSRVAKNVKYCLKGYAPTPEESKLRKLRKQLENPRVQQVFKLICENSGITMKEMADEIGTTPEALAKAVRPLKALDLVEQIDDRAGGVKKTWYRAVKQTVDAD